MKKSKIKLIVILALFLLTLIVLQVSIYATNENIQIIKQSDTEYLIYINDNLDKDFRFALSNDKNIDPETLTYINSASDSIENGNKIAYVNNSNIALFSNDTYIWVKNNSGFVLKGVKIDLNNSISNSELNTVEQISKQIKVDLTQTIKTEEIVNEVKITKTVGKVVLVDEKNYEYQIMSSNLSDDYNNFMKLADKLSKLNNQTSFYTKIETYKVFYDLYEKLLNNLNTEQWLTVKNNEILQPETSIDGEEYILWIRDENNLVDVQFLSCKKEVSQDKIIETITTKLPVTYDNNTLLIVLGILIIASIFVIVRIMILRNRDKQE